jgi:hypothetical protein
VYLIAAQPEALVNIKGCPRINVAANSVSVQVQDMIFMLFSLALTAEGRQLVPLSSILHQLYCQCTVIIFLDSLTIGLHYTAVTVMNFTSRKVAVDLQTVQGEF